MVKSWAWELGAWVGVVVQGSGFHSLTQSLSTTGGGAAAVWTSTSHTQPSGCANSVTLAITVICVVLNFCQGGKELKSFAPLL